MPEAGRSSLAERLVGVRRRSAGVIDAMSLLGSAQPVPAKLTWATSEQDRARMTIKWPVEYQWSEAPQWVGPIRHGISRLVRVIEDRVPQPHTGIVVIRVLVDGRSHDVLIDYSDYTEYDPSLLDRAALCFKMQCPPEADARIVPGGFIPHSEQIYRYLPKLRALRNQRDFAFDVYGRFSTGYATAIRSKAIALLREQTRFAYEGGPKMISYPGYLKEIARARVCIDLPGNGPLCFRRMDYLAVGACVIGPEPPVQLPVAPRDREEVIYTKPDLSDMLDLCEQYLADDRERERVATNARAYFDRCLDRSQLGAYYVSRLLSTLA